MFGNLDELDNRSFRISASSAVYYNLDIERGIHINQLNEYIHTLEANPEKYQTQFDVSSSGTCIMYLGHINEANSAHLFHILRRYVFALLHLTMQLA